MREPDKSWTRWCSNVDSVPVRDAAEAGFIEACGRAWARDHWRLREDKKTIITVIADERRSGETGSRLTVFPRSLRILRRLIAGPAGCSCGVSSGSHACLW